MLEWSEFAQRLGRELAGLDRDTILIVRERDESRHYVQAMREPDRLYAEAVGNNFLDGPLLLTPADEEVMSEAGWHPPAEPAPRNWWTELPPFAVAADNARLADMMVTALRDVQGVRRPSDLVYESFHRLGTGLIELMDFGIPPADPARVSERRSARDGAAQPPAAVASSPLSAPVVQPSPPRHDGTRPVREANGVVPGAHHALAAAPVPVPDDGELEDRLADAKQRGDHVTYFELLLRSELILPATGQAVEDPSVMEFATTTISGTTYVMVFSSPRALAQSLGSRAASAGLPLHRRTTFARLATSWPDPSWSLAINAGLPSEVHLDSAAVARLESTRRAAEQAAAVDAVSAPFPSPAPPELPGAPAAPPAASSTPPLGSTRPPATFPATPPPAPTTPPAGSATPPPGPATPPPGLAASLAAPATPPAGSAAPSHTSAAPSRGSAGPDPGSTSPPPDAAGRPAAAGSPPWSSTPPPGPAEPPTMSPTASSPTASAAPPTAPAMPPPGSPAASTSTGLPPVPMRLPHGAQLWYEDGDEGGAAPVAVYDAISGAWTRIHSGAGEGAEPPRR